MSLNCSLLVSDYSNLKEICEDIENITLGNLSFNNGQNILLLENSIELYIDKQDYLENDGCIEYEAYKYIINYFIKSKSEEEIQNEILYIQNIFEYILLNLRKIYNVSGAIIYDFQSILKLLPSNGTQD